MINEIVQLSITRESAGLARTNFGVPLILGKGTPGAGYTTNPKAYSSAAEVLVDFPNDDDGKATDEYIMASKIFAQDIHPSKIYIGQVIAEDPDQGEFINAYNRIALDNNEFYGVLLTSAADSDDVKAIAKAVATDEQYRILGIGSVVADYSTGANLLNDLKTLNIPRNFYIAEGIDKNFLEAAWTGKMLPFQPGSATWAYKNLNYAIATQFSIGQREAIKADNGNFYSNIAGRDVTFNGIMTNGDYIDNVIGLDWLDNTIKIDMLQLFFNAPIVPYNNNGIGLVQNILNASLEKGVQNGIINSDFVITVPNYLNIPSSDKATRTLNNVKFTATLAGAIQKVVIQGTVTF